MFTIKKTLMLAGVALALGTAGPAGAQGKGGGKGHGAGGGGGPGGGGNPHVQGGGNPHAQGGGPGKGQGAGKGVRDNGPGKSEAKGRGRSDEVRASNAGPKVSRETHAASQGRGKSSNAHFARSASIASMPVAMRHYVSSSHARDVVAAGAVAHAFARGRGNDFRIDDSGNRVRIANRRGDQLVDLDDESADNLGRWRVGVLGDEVRDGAPSFCRSGAGHPVWGRQWCIDKGFGLGGYNDYRWGYTNDVGNIMFPRTGIGSTLTTLALANRLGSTTFNRLALHAVTLGLLEPLTGRWVSQPTGPQMLYVDSGRYPVAELTDTNRDYRVEDLLVALLPF